MAILNSRPESCWERPAESTEDLLGILEGHGLLNAEKTKKDAQEAVEDTGDVLANVLVGVTGLGKGFNCTEQESAVFDARQAALNEKTPSSRQAIRRPTGFCLSR